MTDVPTLTTVRKLRDIATVLESSVKSGDADAAIEMLRDAERCVDKALTDYGVTSRLATAPISRERCLELARGAVERGGAYGAPAETFKRTAELWSTILGWPVKATDVAICLVAVKLVRITECPGHVDSWVDVAGYASLGCETSTASEAEAGDAP